VLYRAAFSEWPAAVGSVQMCGSLRPRVPRSSSDSRGSVKQFCSEDNSSLRVMFDAVYLAMDECEERFRERKWNCSFVNGTMKRLLETGMNNKNYLTNPNRYNKP